MSELYRQSPEKSLKRNKNTNYVVITKQNAKKFEERFEKALKNGALVLILSKLSKSYKLLKLVSVHGQENGGSGSPALICL